MKETKRGIITGLRQFQEDKEGPYILGEVYKSAQYIAIVWPAVDIRQYDSYVMVFRKEPRAIIQAAEWSGSIDELSQIIRPINELLDYYSRGDKYSILLGVGRNTYGERLLNDHLKPVGGYHFYHSICRDQASGVTKNKDGVLCEEMDRLGLVEGLKEAFGKAIIHPFPNHVNVLKNIVVNKGQCHMPEKEEAYIMALAGAYKMYRDYPYRKPIDMRELADLANDMRRSIYSFGK